MNKRLSFKALNHHLFATVLVLVGLILVPMQAGGATNSPVVEVIVQGVAGAELAALVEDTAAR